ncbi:14634_t:CDS:1, partial [Rhizophagus irregularis]
AVQNRSTITVVPIEESSVDESSEEGFFEEIEPSISYTRSLEER